MLITPAGFTAALGGKYDLATRADVFSGTSLLAPDVPFTGDNVDYSRSNFARASTKVTILDPSMAPAGTNRDVLALGNEVRLWRGMSWPVTHLCPLITGVITDTDVAYDATGKPRGVDVTLISRLVRISDARLPWPVNVSGSAFLALQSLVQGAGSALPLTISSELEDVDLPKQTFQRDRDQAVKAIVAALGAEIRETGMGQIVVAPIPDPQGTPDGDVIEGGNGKLLISGSRTLSRQGVFNGITTVPSTSGAKPVPKSDLIVDLDPRSPTYWYGPFGQKPGFIDSTLVTSKDQGNAMSRAQLRNTIGVARSVKINAIPDPSFEPGDLKAFRWPDGRFEQHILDTLSMPLTENGVMTASTRATQIITDGVT